MDSKFVSFVPIYFGKGSLHILGKLAADMGIKKVLIVCDGSLTAFGSRAADILQESGIESLTFCEIQPEPTDESIQKGVNAASDRGVDGIIGIGGGSSLDTAKCINVMLNNPDDLTTYASIGKDQPTKPGFPLILIPTTAGTGAECTFSSIFTCTATGQKMSVRKPNCTLARAAVVDPVLSMQMPKMLTLASGVDALCHAMEAYTVKQTNPVSDALAKESVSLVYQYLPRAVNNGMQDMEAREQMANAAALAGMAFGNTMLHLAHAIGHSMGAVLHQPHGLIVGQALPEVMEWIGEVYPKRISSLGVQIGVPLAEMGNTQKAGKIVKKALYRFYEEIGFPTLQDMGISLEEIMKAVPLVEKDGCFRFSPRSMDRRQIAESLRHIYERT